MSLQNLIQMLLNILVFAFIGFLIWLYVEKEPVGEEQEEKRGSAPEVKNRQP